MTLTHLSDVYAGVGAEAVRNVEHGGAGPGAGHELHGGAGGGLLSTLSQFFEWKQTRMQLDSGPLV